MFEFAGFKTERETEGVESAEVALSDFGVSEDYPSEGEAVANGYRYPAASFPLTISQYQAAEAGASGMTLGEFAGFVEAGFWWFLTEIHLLKF